MNRGDPEAALKPQPQRLLTVAAGTRFFPGRLDLRGGLDGAERERLVAAIREQPAPCPPAPCVEYRLDIRRDGEGHAAQWTGPDGKGSAEFPLSLPLAKQDLEDLRWYLGTYLEFPRRRQSAAGPEPGGPPEGVGRGPVSDGFRL